MKLIQFFVQLALGVILLYLAVNNLQDGDMGWAVFDLVFGVLNLTFSVHALE